MARYRASAIGNVSMTGDTAARRETFEFTGQSSAGVVPLKRGLIILDTNVMSVLESVARKGFRASDVQHRRVEHLLRWLYARPDDQMFTLFGVLEGAGFHEGGVSSYQMFRRAIATSAVVAWARDHIDELVTSEISLPKSAWGTVDVGYNSDRVSLDGGEWAGADDSGLDFASELLPLTVLPCYVASRAAAAAWRGKARN
jgi:hypothetical protein